MTQFYTYLHCKPDGMPFYVGKGSVNRAYELVAGRKNKHHRNIVDKYGKENIGIFVFPCDSEEQEFADEIQQIAQLRRDGYRLSNKTDGGEGASGLVVTPETRMKQSINSQSPKRRIDLTGKSFGAWIVVESSGLKTLKTGVKKHYWLCHCKCGTIRDVEATSLRNGLSVGCGCTKRIAISNAQRNMSDETRRKHSEASKGTKYRLGRKHTPETIEKMKLAQANLHRGNS